MTVQVVSVEELAALLRISVGRAPMCRHDVYIHMIRLNLVDNDDTPAAWGPALLKPRGRYAVRLWHDLQHNLATFHERTA